MDRNKFCPVIKEVCKNEICLAWNGENCSILTFFKCNVVSDNVWFGNNSMSREQVLADEAKVEQLMPECLEWARSKKITRPTRADQDISDCKKHLPWPIGDEIVMAAGEGETAGMEKRDGAINVTTMAG